MRQRSPGVFGPLQRASTYDNGHKPLYQSKPRTPPCTRQDTVMQDMDANVALSRR